jgi:hypothetical protein
VTDTPVRQRPGCPHPGAAGYDPHPTMLGRLDPAAEYARYAASLDTCHPGWEHDDIDRMAPELRDEARRRLGPSSMNAPSAKGALSAMPKKPRTQFVFLAACGCPFGVTEGAHAKTEDGAWDNYTGAEQRAMAARGVTVVHVAHDEYVATYLPKMYSSYTCPHVVASR